MNGELFLGSGGHLMTYPAEVAAIRWGGGADPGKTHVFLMTSQASNFFDCRGLQCVVDDFGDLVAVPS